jgi:hypothetical protein
MLWQNGGNPPDFISNIPRNLWTMPRLDKNVDALAWAAHVTEFYDELLYESQQKDTQP